jgi:hypothetical protein
MFYDELLALALMPLIELRSSLVKQLAMRAVVKVSAIWSSAPMFLTGWSYSRPSSLSSFSNTCGRGFDLSAAIRLERGQLVAGQTGRRARLGGATARG